MDVPVWETSCAFGGRHSDQAVVADARIYEWILSMDELGRDLADEAGEMVSGPVASATAELRKRRSTRIVQAVPLVVMGVDALGRPFNERTSSLIINCHGCRYQSKHYVLKNMWVTLEVPHPEEGQPPRAVRGRVAWIQRPRTVRQLFQVALELEVPGNVWGIAFPPEDWFAFPEGEQAKAAAVGSAASHSVLAEPRGEPQNEQREHATPRETDFHIPLSDEDLAASGQNNLRVFPAPESITDASLQMARQFTRLMTEARQQIQAAAREAATHAVSAERRINADQWDQQFASAREQLSQQLANAIANIQQESVNRSRAAQNAAIEALQSDLPRWIAPQLEELTRDLTAQLSQEALVQQHLLSERSINAVENLKAACHQAEEITAGLTERVAQSQAQLADRAEAATRVLEDAARQHKQALEARNDSLAATANEIQERVASFLASVQQGWHAQLADELEAGQARTQIAVDNALSAAQAQAAGSLNEQAN